jgi:hypothetical protein
VPSADRSFSVCAGSRETGFDEGVYVLDHGVFDHLLDYAVLRHFVFAHSKKGAPGTKGVATETIIANLGHFGRTPAGISAAV